MDKYQFDEAIQFCSALFAADELIEVRPIEIWLDQRSGKRKSRVLRSERRWFARRRMADELRQLAELNTNENANIFFGVNPRIARGGGRKNDVAKVRCLWADMDNVTTELAKWRCEESGVPVPSIVVDSGNGVHLYWLIDGLLDVSTDRSRALLEARLRLLYRRLGCDATCDVNRLLRLPGFMNVKNARNCDQPSRCRLQHCSPECRYKIESFAAILDRGHLSDRQATREAKYVTLPSNAKDHYVRRLSVNVNDRSRRDFAIVCSLVRAGYGEDDIRDLVTPHSKFADRGGSYFETTFRNALIAVQS